MSHQNPICGEKGTWWRNATPPIQSFTLWGWEGGKPALLAAFQPCWRGGTSSHSQSPSPRANLHCITQDAPHRDTFFFPPLSLFAKNSQLACVINKIGDRKLIQPRDALFIPGTVVMIDLRQLIHAN